MKPIIITVQPDDEYFKWQNHLYIESCLESGFDQEQIHILLYKPKGRPYNTNWDKLKEYYPNINIFLYEDKGVGQHLSTYIPILRPHTLWQHFEAFPELQNKTIIYTDCDILWIKGLDIEKLYSDEINYISDAKSYLNYSYFESKNKQILEHKQNDLLSRDFLKEICDIVGIDKQLCIDNDNNTGGVQYILKNITSDFWKKVEKDVLSIRKHLLEVNKEFFESENKGIQSWCADLWAVQFNLWFHNKEVRVVSELNFAWSTDPITRLQTYKILHNAGITSPVMNKVPSFFKGLYHNGGNPFNKGEHLYQVLESEESQKLCTGYYANKLNELNNKYNLTN